MKPVRLGIIGLSEGNGHPYSWSAIFNGYDSNAMDTCGFPVISAYLGRQRFPDDAISEAQVTHVWTQDRKLSEQIALASKIDCVVDHVTDMIGHIDGVLLARDDAERHYELAAPFLDTGLPIYIDKPVSLSLKELNRLYALQRYPGQIFTCSALRYAKELQLSDTERNRLGTLKYIHAIAPKDWDRYAIHAIEPMLVLIGNRNRIRDLVRLPHYDDGGGIFIVWCDGLRVQVSAMGRNVVAPISLRIMGTNGWCDLIFSDTFSAFKAALADFVKGIIHGDVRSDPVFVRRVVQLIEAGRSK